MAQGGVGVSLMVGFPPELYLEIFSNACNDQPKYNASEGNRPYFLSASSPQLVLTHVCQHWRKLMLSHSSLWTWICLGTSRYYSAPLLEPLIRQKDMLDAWLSRSNGRPLSFVLHFVHRPEDADVQVFQAAAVLAQTVAAQSFRWAYLDASCFHDIFYTICPFVSTKHSPILEVANLTVCSEQRGVPIMQVPKTLKLTKFCLERGAFLLASDFVGVWESLTRFSYNADGSFGEALAIRDTYKVLTCCPALQSFHLGIRQGQPPRPAVLRLPTRRATVHVPALLELSLSSEEASDFDILDELQAENLKQLSVVNPADSVPEEFEWNHINSFLKRSRPPLELLCIHYVPMSPEMVIDCLAMVPTLHELDLEGQLFDECVVSHLLWNPCSDTGVNLLPLLQSLTILDCISNRPLLLGLAIMVRSRLIHTFKSGEGDLETGEILETPENILNRVKFAINSNPWLEDLQRMAYNDFLFTPFIQHYQKLGLLRVVVEDALDFILDL